MLLCDSNKGVEVLKKVFRMEELEGLVDVVKSGGKITLWTCDKNIVLGIEIDHSDNIIIYNFTELWKYMISIA